MVTPEVKKQMEAYMMMCCWYRIHQSDEVLEEKVKEMQAKIEVAEDDLRKVISQEALQKVLDRCDAFLKTPIDEMTRDEQLRVCRLVYGPQMRWT